MGSVVEFCHRRAAEQRMVSGDMTEYSTHDRVEAERDASRVRRWLGPALHTALDRMHGHTHSGTAQKRSTAARAAHARYALHALHPMHIATARTATCTAAA